MVSFKRTVRLLYYFIVACITLFTVIVLLIPGRSMIVDYVIDAQYRFYELDSSLGKNVTMVRFGNESVYALDVRRKSATSWGYFLVVDYEQQLMGGYMAFYHLANISSMLNLSSVEPYIRKTGLEGAPFIDRGLNPQVVKLSAFYDIVHLRRLIKSCCMNNNLVSFEAFLERSSRDVVLVAFLYTLSNHEQYFVDGSKVVEIDRPTQSLLNGLSHLNQWTSYVSMQRNWHLAPFRPSRAVLIDARPQHPLPLSHLISRLSSVVRKQVQQFGSATVIVDIFRDIQLSYNSRFFSYFPGFNWKNCPEMDTVKHSQQIIESSKQFALSLKQVRPVVAIHIRMERILTEHKVRVSEYLECFRRLKKFLLSGRIANLSTSLDSVFVFHDVGKYGTKRCIYKSECLRGRPYLLHLLHRMGLKVVAFEPESFHPPGVRSAFSAHVEMEYLSNVDVLVTLGFGEYQGHVIKRFVKNHGGKRNNHYQFC